MKDNIRLLDLEEINEQIRSLGFKRSHASDLYQSIWHQFLTDFVEMKSLPEELRQQLQERYFIPQTSVFNTQLSIDGTIKCSIRLHDDHLIEGVLIPTESRVTACVSSQVGCSLSCKFCATGYMGRKRNVSFDEIVDQVVLLNKFAIQHYQKPITNVVFMGMGEPMLNYQNVLKAVEKLTDQKGLSIAPRRITISTAGIAKMIQKLANENVKINLALSLHAANDVKRNEIMPINQTNNLQELQKALIYFAHQSRNEITIEYILLQDFNDSIQDAEELIAFVNQIPVHLVNILEYNTIENANFRKPAEEVMNTFLHHLNKHNINAHLRRSRGKDIAGSLRTISQYTLGLQINSSEMILNRNFYTSTCSKG